MRVTILEQPPMSGSIIEHRYHARGSCTWVQFDAPDSGRSVGVFGKGRLPASNHVAAFADGITVCVIAGGRGYVIDLADHRLLHRTHDDGLCSVIAIPDT